MRKLYSVALDDSRDNVLLLHPDTGETVLSEKILMDLDGDDIAIMDAAGRAVRRYLPPDDEPEPDDFRRGFEAGAAVTDALRDLALGYRLRPEQVATLRKHDPDFYQHMGDAGHPVA